MKTFYDKNYHYTPDAIAWDNLVRASISPLIEECIREGYSPREASYLFQCAIRDLEMEITISGVLSKF